MRELLLFVALIASRVYGSCDCSYGSVPGASTNVCLGGNSVVSCLTGQINVTVGNVKYAFDKATCLDNEWYGSTCEGAIFMITETNPFFNCYDTVVPTTVPTTTGPTTVPTTTGPTTVPTTTGPTTVPTTTGPNVPNIPPMCPPSACTFEDTGASLNLPLPVASCDNGVNLQVECDEKIFVKIGTGLTEYDRITCSDGKWYGMNCDGTLSAIDGGATAKVQCGAVEEPPLCALLPHRGGLKFVGTTDSGLERYTCHSELIYRMTIEDGEGSGTVHGKFFECNSTYGRVLSTDSHDFIYFYAGTVVGDVSCRDYGTRNEACTIPAMKNAWYSDGIITCDKGFVPLEISFVTGADSAVEKIHPGPQHSSDLSKVFCNSAGWNIEGTAYAGLRLTKYHCRFSAQDNLNCAGTGPSIHARNIFYEFKNIQYKCTNKETLQLTTPDNNKYYGSTVGCNYGPKQWELKGTEPTFVVPAGSSIACVPPNSGAIPAGTYSLVSGGTWHCGPDLTLSIEIAFDPENGGRMHAHAAYIEANDTMYYIKASNTKYGYQPQLPILSVSCVDLGPKFAACPTPWAVDAIRVGDEYKCMKGFFLHVIRWENDDGTPGHYGSPPYGIRCLKDGWQIQGTPFSGLRVRGLHCKEASALAIANTCLETLTFKRYTLNVNRIKYDATCYPGETLGYRIGGAEPVMGQGKKVFCGKNASSGESEWQWSNMDDSDVSALPAGAEMDCFA